MIKVILYMAISADGFIAKKDGDSDWVSPTDTPNFEGKIKEIGCIVMGKRTFDQFRGELYPVKGVTNIVVTTSRSQAEEIEETIFVHSPQEALKVAEENGHSEILLIGGGTTNGLFLKENLIYELFLVVHPLVLGDGIKLFENCEIMLNMKLVGSKQLEEGLIQLHYQVVK